MATKRAFQRNLTDAALRTKVALPAAAGAVVTPAIDTGERSVRASFVQDIEARVSIPALNATMVPDTRTVTVVIQASDDPTFAGGVEDLRTKVLTGAGGAGVKAGKVRVGITSDARRYYRAKATTGASTGDASSKEMVFELVR